jgi:hypothetical protein
LGDDCSIFVFVGRLASPFRSKSRLVAENALLRHQVFVLRRRGKGRILFRRGDRWFFVELPIGADDQASGVADQFVEAAANSLCVLGTRFRAKRQSLRDQSLAFRLAPLSDIIVSPE